MLLKDWLPLLATVVGFAVNGVILAMQQRRLHRLDAIATAFKAEVDLNRGRREAAFQSHRGLIERQIADIQAAIVKAQRVKNAISNLTDAASQPDTFPRAATILELEGAADEIADAHGDLTKWFTFGEMVPLHRCKSECATLAAIASAHVTGVERITSVSNELLKDLAHCRELADAAQTQLRSMATSNQRLLGKDESAPHTLG